MNIKSRNIRNLPYFERLKLIKCLKPTELANEVIELINDYPDYDNEEILFFIYDNCQANEFKQILRSNCIKNFNITLLVNKIIDGIMTILNSQLMINHEHAYDYLILTAKKVNEFSINLDIVDLLTKIEDCFILVFLDKYNYSKNTSHIRSFIEQVENINQWKLINAMLQTGDPEVIKTVKSIIYCYPESDPLRQRIKDYLDVYDIIS